MCPLREGSACGNYPNCLRRPLYTEDREADTEPKPSSEHNAEPKDVETIITGENWVSVRLLVGSTGIL